MNNHKKIDWFRWHQRKMWIRINCAILTAILIIVLLFMFPIVSDADTPKIKDYYFCNAFYDIDVGTEKYGSTIGSGLHYFVSDNPMQYYDAVKDLFDCEFPVSNQINYDTQRDFAIFTKNGDSNKLIFMFCNACYFNLYQGNQPFFNANGGSPYYEYDITNKTLTRSQIGSTSTYTNINDLVDKFLTGSCSTPWQTQNSTEVNYLRVDGLCGKGSGGFGVSAPIDSSILNNDYIGENSFMYGDGVSINQWNLIIGLDLNESQMKNISNYHYTLDCTLQANYTLAKGLTRNQETSLLQSYGLSWAGNNRNVVTMDFSKTYTDSLSSNYFTIPSTVFNDGLLCNGYTAVPLVNYIATYVPKGSTTNEIQSFFIAMSNVNVGPFSLPGYNETEWFNNCSISYNFSMNVYNENDDLITSLPLAMSYNPMTGQQDNYSNGGGKSKNEVQQTINQNNENKTPDDSDYKDPQDYTPTISPSNNDNSSNSNSNSSSNSSPTIYNNASITLPKSETYPTTGLMRSFVRIINNDKNDTVEDLDNITGASSYIALMNNALSVIPQQVWNIWIISLKALFGITISAFFLKILINWAT